MKDDTYFDPDSISDEFWNFIKDAQVSKSECIRILENLSEEDFIKIFLQFDEARTELIFEFSEGGPLASKSEDTLFELADRIVWKGKTDYMNAFNANPSPDPDNWFGAKSFSSQFSNVFDEKFDGELYDYLPD